jgi:hypothetical protein
MKSLKYIDRINKIHSLINSEKRGTPEAFTKKLYLCRRQMYNELEFFKTLNAPIRYCKKNETFYYDDNFEIKFEFSLTIISRGESRRIFHLSSEDYPNCITQKNSLCVQ